MHQTPAGRVDVRVSGRVQGVGFRWWAVREARRLGLRGTVRNLPDGSVEVRAAGTVAAVGEFTAALSEGPPHARVHDIEPIPPTGPLPAEFRAER